MENLVALRLLLDNKLSENEDSSALRAAVLLRATALLLALNVAASPAEAAEASEKALRSGAAGHLADRFVALSVRFSVAGSSGKEDILSVIARQRRRDVAAARAQCSLEELMKKLAGAPPAIDFVARLQRCQPTAVMAEVKRASPSKGDIAPGIDAAAQALKYAQGGAAAISVLTEPTWFKGTLEDMRRAREAVGAALGEDRPAILRKDFLLEEYQIVEARVHGADTVLLIVAILSDEELTSLLAASRKLGMEPLVEVANAPEMERALALGARVVGINNRNLKDFTVDTSTTQRVLDSARQRLGSGLILAALSGISSRTDVQVYRAAGCHAVLVGEALMRVANPGALIASLRGLHPHQPLVKICGLMDVATTRATISAGADLIGLVFAPESRRCLDIDTARAIAAAVHNMAPSGVPADVVKPPAVDSSSGRDSAAAWYTAQAARLRQTCAWRPLLVGVFANQPIEDVLNIARAVPLDIVQLSGTEGLDAAADYASEFLVVKAVHVGEGDSGDAIAGRLCAVAPASARSHVALLDTKSPAALGGTGVAFDWGIAAAVEAAGQPIFLAGGLTPKNVAEAVGRVRPFALDVSSGVETEGVKDVAKIAALIGRAKGATF